MNEKEKEKFISEKRYHLDDLKHLQGYGNMSTIYNYFPLLIPSISYGAYLKRVFEYLILYIIIQLDGADRSSSTFLSCTVHHFSLGRTCISFSRHFHTHHDFLWY